MKRPSSPITCGGCERTWTGVRRAHCSACHETFNSPSLFDRHRTGHSCRSASTLGLENVAGVWMPPKRPLDAAARDRIARLRGVA